MDIAYIRALINDGLNDEQIAEIVINNQAAADDHEAMYGSDNTPDSGGPVHLHDDGYYARNDAGEYCWM